MLELYPHTLKYLLPVLPGIHTQNPGRTGIRGFQSQDQIDGGAFSGAVVPQKREDLALFHVKGQIVHHFPAAEGLGQIGNADRWFIHRKILLAFVTRRIVASPLRGRVKRKFVIFSENIEKGRGSNGFRHLLFAFIGDAADGHPDAAFIVRACRRAA